ncbi:hypothetical protein AAVH_13565 [Aphelenchoides avenae]|nr:hypothetical protein AAVH_13565 [Aphelenchus avenae]
MDAAKPLRKSPIRPYDESGRVRTIDGINGWAPLTDGWVTHRERLFGNGDRKTAGLMADYSRNYVTERDGIA